MLRYHQSCYLYAPWRRVFPSPVPRTTQMLVRADNPRMPILFGGSGVLVRCSMPYARNNDHLHGIWTDCVVATAKASYTLNGLTVPARYDYWGTMHDRVVLARSATANHTTALWVLTESKNQVWRFWHNHNQLITVVGTKAAICSLAHHLGDRGFGAQPCVITDELAKRQEFDATLAHLQYDYKIAALFHRY